MRICVILNPTAGQSRSGESREAIRENLEPRCGSLLIRETRARGDAEAMAAAIEPGEFDLVVPAGGDGTINEVVNGLGSGIPVGLLPLGTANVLARELGIPVDDIPAACALLLQGRARPIDLGCCSGRRFTLMVGIGFDAEAVREVPPNVKDLIGAPAYLLSALRALTRLDKPLRYRLTLPEGRKYARGMMLVAANASLYAGTLSIAPMASIEDGLLDFCLFRERSPLAFAGQLVNVLLRRQLQDPHFVTFRTRAARVECRPPAAVQLDGDYFGRTPVEIRVLPGALSVVRPAGPAPGKGGDS